MVAVDFGATKENEAEFVTFLEPNDIFCPNGVCLPEVLVVVLAIPPSILRREMIHAVEAAGAKQSLELMVLADVATKASISFSAVAIACQKLVTAGANLFNQTAPHEASPTH